FFQQKNLDTLRAIFIYEVDETTQHLLDRFVDFCPRLANLTLFGKRPSDVLDLRLPTQQKLPHLRYLQLQLQLKDTDQILELLNICPVLSKLDLKTVQIPDTLAVRLVDCMIERAEANPNRRFVILNKAASIEVNAYAD